MIVALPNELLACVLERTTHGSLPLSLAALRATCTGLRREVALCAALLHTSQLNDAQHFSMLFPCCTNGKVVFQSFQHWIQNAMIQQRSCLRADWRELRLVTGSERVRIAVQLQQRDRRIQDALQLPSFYRARSDQLKACWFCLLDTLREERVRVRNDTLVHVELESVVTAFASRGWSLDAAAALLFLRACASRIDFGNTWIATPRQRRAQGAMERLCALQATVEAAVREHAPDDDLVVRLRAFNIDWVVNTHAMVHSTISSSACNVERRYLTSSRHWVATLVSDFQQRRVAIEQCAKAHYGEESVAARAVERKLNASLPSAVFDRNA